MVAPGRGAASHSATPGRGRHRCRRNSHLPEAVDLESAFLDTTCLSANIHYPVDWVLLRDATRTLMKAVQLIRGQGLKHRMEAPQSFLTPHQPALHSNDPRRQQDRSASASARKPCARWTGWWAPCVITPGATAICWSRNWPQTQWTRPQAQQVLRRMDQVLEQLPQARKQARQRIIRASRWPMQTKILSLYEPEVHVIVRKKAGAEVEFGNTLLLAENPQGLILDWELFRQSAPADSALLPRTWVGWKKSTGPDSKRGGRPWIRQ